ncbi:NTP/NDP exchange transporter [Pseudomarimonas arenosa]|uniref:MFS transporter n=1 Tax=Pseudomarimonas arenosa TaxID=2774145 RepID=A0AAW3ZJ52_9GAMM|nr:MFS transporter [Pseudomarimonas arenosa]MBD8524965.1 MFS transporter [Pseudomarimonas arenosa]
MSAESDGSYWQRMRADLAGSPPLLWAFLYFYCLLCGYYVLRPVREAMGAASDVYTVFPPWLVDLAAARSIDLGQLTLQILFSATFVIMLLLQPAYGWLVSRFPRRVFLPTVYTVFVVTLLGFYLAFDSGLPGRGMLFFLWITVFNLFAVAVFWSFMADVFTDSEARRLYGWIGAAGTLGAISGPLLTTTLVSRLGIANLMLVSAVLLVLCIVCILRLRLWAVQREQQRGLRSGEVPMGGQLLAGLKLIAQQPLLRWMALAVFFGVSVGTLLYNEQRLIVQQYYPEPEASTAYYAMIDLGVNTLTLLVQLLLTRWVLSRWGIGPALLGPALIILVAFMALTASPLPLIVAIAQILTRASEFALAKPARETIYTRVDREWRYKSGAAIDTVIYRGGDLSFVWVHKFVSGFGSSAVFATGVLCALFMCVAGFGLWREQKKLPRDVGGPIA